MSLLHCFTTALPRIEAGPEVWYPAMRWAWAWRAWLFSGLKSEYSSYEVQNRLWVNTLGASVPYCPCYTGCPNNHPVLRGTWSFGLIPMSHCNKPQAWFWGCLKIAYPKVWWLTTSLPLSNWPFLWVVDIDQLHIPTICVHILYIYIYIVILK